MATKILVVGAINGQLEKALQKITKLHSKTDFAFALVIGDLFSEPESTDVQALLSGETTVPLPTYFTVGDQSLPEAVQHRLESDATGEVCSNLFYLGRKGTHTIDGIKIVYLGGRQVQSEGVLTQSIGKYDPLFLENEARALQGNHSAHILITNQWPSNIDSGSDNPLPEEIDTATSLTSIANLCAVLKPRYHFSSSPSFSWKREPFIWPMDYTSDGSDPMVTRFESLGNINLKSSQWISAFTLDPSKPASTQDAQRSAPFTTTTSAPKRKRETLDPDPYPGRFHLNGNGDSHRPRKGNKRPKFQNPDDCFMCLGKPTFDASMLISISEECFLTSLRGPLTAQDTFPQLKSTGNLMVIPMYHAADDTSSSTRNAEAVQLEYNNMQQYRHALQHMILTKGDGSLGCVCWEVNRTGVRHFHWQFLACPQNLVSQRLVEGAFKIAAEKNEYQKFQSCTPNELIKGRRSDYFRVWIWSAELSDHKRATGNGASPVEQADAIAAGNDPIESAHNGSPAGTTETSMYFELPPEQRGFNIQFGRTVMSGLLKLEHRADWRSVPSEEGDEARDAEAWKEDFAQWDFAMS